MTPQGHYDFAEELVTTVAQDRHLDAEARDRILRLAQVHATLALYRPKKVHVCEEVHS